MPAIPDLRGVSQDCRRGSQDWHCDVPGFTFFTSFRHLSIIMVGNVIFWRTLPK